jgi:hypothetical protein
VNSECHHASPFEFTGTLKQVTVEAKRALEQSPDERAARNDVRSDNALLRAGLGDR